VVNSLWECRAGIRDGTQTLRIEWSASQALLSISDEERIVEKFHLGCPARIERSTSFHHAGTNQAQSSPEVFYTIECCLRQ
ncbi:hypothetical protein HAX54_035367, partial [Datura stramonium]|nr:hypothetical protein [Datura stramonium]